MNKFTSLTLHKGVWEFQFSLGECEQVSPEWKYTVVSSVRGKHLFPVLIRGTYKMLKHNDWECGEGQVKVL